MLFSLSVCVCAREPNVNVRALHNTTANSTFFFRFVVTINDYIYVCVYTWLSLQYTRGEGNFFVNNLIGVSKDSKGPWGWIMTWHPKYIFWTELYCDYGQFRIPITIHVHTVCPRSSYPFYIVSYYFLDWPHQFF